jgi:hypothetical protein
MRIGYLHLNLIRIVHFVRDTGLVTRSRQGGSQPAKGRQESADGRMCDSGQHLDSESQNRGSTGSLSSASTPKTHSCVRPSGSLRINRSKASWSRVINCPTGHAHQSADHLVRDFYETVGRLERSCLSSRRQITASPNRSSSKQHPTKT